MDESLILDSVPEQIVFPPSSRSTNIDVSGRVRNNAPSGKVFGCILYPDCPSHLWLLEYLKQSTFSPDWVIGILHDKESDSVENLSDDFELDEHNQPKAHYHVMFKFSKRYTAGSVEKQFSGVVKHIELISNEIAYLKYMLHQDFRSKYIDLKPEYKYEVLFSNNQRVLQAFLDKTQILFNCASDLMDFIVHYGSISVFDYIRQQDPAFYDDYDHALRYYGWLFKQASYEFIKLQEIQAKKQDGGSL